MPDKERWDIEIVRQERGTKNEKKFYVRGFSDRESAVKAVEELETQASRGGSATIAIDSPDGNSRFTIVAMDFRMATVHKAV